MMDLTVKDIPQSQGREYIVENHYTGGCGVASMIWGLFDGDEMVGAIAYQTPISENVRKAIFGSDDCWCDEVDGGSHGFHQHVTELHRLVTDDDLHETATSWFISQSLDRLKQYKPKYWAVISHADMTEGHDGTVYQATNAIYTGVADGSVYYRTPDGQLKPPRDCGENISHEQAKKRGWNIEHRDGKHRYLFLLPNGKRHRRWMVNNLQYKQKPYPNPSTEKV